MNRLRQLWWATAKFFDLPRHLRAVRDERTDPRISAPVLTTSLLLGALLRLPSFLQLEAETRRRGWQRLLGRSKPISDDTLGYGMEHARLEDLRQLLVATNQTLKRAKAFEAAKINGLLVVAVDGNEQFKSRARCCPDCSERRIKVTQKDGQVIEVTEYYHRHVYAQLPGPSLSVVLDLEPIRPKEEEAAVALRLLGRIRRLYGPRFFDVLAVDAWYTTGPFLKAVQRLGWGVVSVLKQERYEIYQEATALTKDQAPQHYQWEGRNVRLWEAKDLPFTDEAIGLMRVVLAQEQWPQAKRVGRRKEVKDQQSTWRWLVSPKLDAYPAPVIWQIGHRRWGIENHAFNELTQHYHLEHCPHHHPVAIVAWLLILMLAFNVFEWFSRLHCKLYRLGKTTLQELARQLYLGLARWEELDLLWSG
jgi:hypothetical protein